MSAALEPLLQLRPMTAGELDAVMNVETGAYSHPWRSGNFVDSMRAGYDCRILRDGAELIGYFVLSVAVSDAHLLNFTIAPAWHRRGHGRDLLARVLRVAKDGGAERIFLEVRPSNIAGVTLYEKSGFAQVGRRPGYYPAIDGREDALVFARDV